MTPLEKLKYSQHMYKKEWKGIPPEYTGRPGTSQLCNNNRSFKVYQKSVIEDERADMFHRLFSIVHNIE